MRVKSESRQARGRTATLVQRSLKRAPAAEFRGFAKPQPTEPECCSFPFSSSNSFKWKRESSKPRSIPLIQSERCVFDSTNLIWSTSREIVHTTPELMEKHCLHQSSVYSRKYSPQGPGLPDVSWLWGTAALNDSPSPHSWCSRVLS